jgi:hypothetical protein
LPLLDDDNNSTDDDDLDMPLLQRNPLTYFLTPSTPAEPDLELEFDFDAGIEDSNSPKRIVRSVSPSTLDGLKRYKPRDRQNECAIIDDDDDDEDYIRFKPSKKCPLGLPDFDLDRSKAVSLLSPTGAHVSSPRGGSAKHFSPPRRPLLRGRARSLPLQRRHSWREPSPDVWSIEEEPDKETMSEMGPSVPDLNPESEGTTGTTRPIDIPAAKPKKRVRFVLPA